MQNVAHNIRQWVASPHAEQPLLLISSSDTAIFSFAEIAKLALVSTDLPAGRQVLEKKQIQSGNHPDIFTVTGENNRIYVKHIEALKPLLVHRAKKRIVIIPHADQILTQAASALLKVLEEPSISTRFLLGAKSKRSILPTIRSRCRVIFAAKEAQEEGTVDTKALLTRLSGMRKPDPFSEEDLQDIARLIHTLALEGDSSSAVFQVAMRLRDYYKTATVTGGNTKLAADILLASLANLRNTVVYVNHTS